MKTFKTCTKCKEVKELGEFYKGRSNSYSCKICKSAIVRINYLKQNPNASQKINGEGLKRRYKLEDENPDYCWCSFHKKLCPKKGRGKGSSRFHLNRVCLRGNREYRTLPSTKIIAKKSYDKWKKNNPFSWMMVGIMQRCYNPKSRSYSNYGGRGITVHGPWRKDYSLFVKYMEDSLGFCPKGKQLDRINNSKGYIPGNLRWATPKENVHNTRAKITNAQHDTDIAAMQKEIDSLRAQIENKE